MTLSSKALSVALVLALALASRGAEAQVCAGAAPFSNGPVRVGIGGGGLGAGFGSADGEQALGVQVAVGAMRGAFANVGASIGLSADRFLREDFAASESDDAASGTVSVNGGYSVSLPTSRYVELCPVAGFASQSGPNMWRQCTPLEGGGKSCSDAVRGTARAVWFGGNVGMLHQASPGFAFVPFAGAAYVSSRLSGDGRSQTDDYVELNLGAGLVASRMTIRPTLSVPMGLEGGGRSIGLQFAFSMGPKRAGNVD